MGKSKSKTFQRKGGYFSIDRAVYTSPAFTSLSCTERAVLLQLVFHYVPKSSERIVMSSRQLASCIGINKDTAAKALRRLVDVGLIDVVSESKWIYSLARVYRLTFKPYQNRIPTDEWSKYQDDDPKQSDNVSESS